MKKTALLLVVAGIAAAFAPGSIRDWKNDSAHTRLGFTVTHLLISEVNGEFKDYQLTVDSKKEDFTDAKIKLTINAASIDTDHKERDHQIKTRFFDLKKHPQIVFESTLVKWAGDGKLKVIGKLTMNGITRTETFDVKHGGTVNDPINSLDKAGFKLSGTLNRLDYGLRWNVPHLTDTYAVSEEIMIDCSVRLNAREKNMTF